MTVVNSKDYHDYVIKDGKFVGEFEQMYQNSEDTPWHQDQEDQWLDVRLALEFIRDLCPFDVICDLGCGLGYYLNRISCACGTNTCSIHGLDISQTACSQAKTLSPSADFQQADLIRNVEGITIPNGNRRLFLMRGTLWYVCHKMDHLIENIGSLTTPGDYFLLTQNFPPLDSNFVGKEVLPTPDVIPEMFHNNFKEIRTLWLNEKSSDKNDNWYFALMERL